MRHCRHSPLIGGDDASCEACGGGVAVAADGVDGMEGWCERDDDVSKSSEVKI